MSVPNETQVIDRLVRMNLESVERLPAPIRRGQHPKHHGCVAATFRVRDDIPEDLRRGVFAAAREYSALIRFSNGRARDDRKADVHGMAIKLLDVPGPKLLSGREQEGAQDFVLIDKETFFTGDPAEYELVGEMVLGTDWRVRLSAFARLLRLNPRVLLRIVTFRKRRRSPLTSPYFSTVPYRLGGAFVKYVAMPRDAARKGRLTGPNGLAEALAKALAERPAAFDFGVDVQVDPAAQPVEDPTRCWSTVPGARRVWLAEVIIPTQPVDPAAALAENLVFSPWHALREHEPVGFINRSRKPIYRTMAKERHARNGVSPEESSEAPPGYGAKPVPTPGADTE